VEELLYQKHLRQPHPQIHDENPYLVCFDTNDNNRIDEILSRHLAAMHKLFSQRCKNRRKSQNRIAQIQDHDLRELTLLECMGVKRYQRANVLLKTIDQIGIELTGDCGRCENRHCDNRMKLAHGSMPEPVRQLFCQTSLRTQMYVTPLSHLKNIAWEESLTKAEHCLHEYTKWSQQYKDNCAINTGNAKVDAL
jgi:hypothetical protein